MSKNQHEESANELWLYFCAVIEWVKTVFPAYRREMKGLPWGELYNEHGKKKLPSASDLESRIKELMEDDDVTKKSGVYQYLITGEEKHLNIRAFTDNQKRKAFEKQKGKCPMCGDVFEIAGMEGDHIIPWSEGGKTSPDNLQMLCKGCNRKKWNK
jgi:hypothetical protein